MVSAFGEMRGGGGVLSTATGVWARSGARSGARARASLFKHREKHDGSSDGDNTRDPRERANWTKRPTERRRIAFSRARGSAEIRQLFLFEIKTSERRC
jgi:hypothetical protein